MSKNRENSVRVRLLGSFLGEIFQVFPTSMWELTLPLQPDGETRRTEVV